MHVLGIDLAKRSFDVTLLNDSGERQHAQFAASADGFVLLHDWLVKQGVDDLHACMEATNVYFEPLAAFLHAKDFTVSVVNPARIKGYAISRMQRSKTDKLDSFIIASFCAESKPLAWTPPSEQQRKLRALVRHRDDLLQTRIQLSNRLEDSTDELVRQSLQTLLAAVKQQIEAVEAQLKAHLRRSELHSTLGLVTAVVGIGVLTAYKLLSEYGDMTQYSSARAVSADAGLTPAHYESGTSVRRRSRLSKVGKADVRAALYWPAITAMTHCPAFKAFAQRLLARGKPKKVVIVAVMRKLLHVIYGVLKHKTPYDPNKVLGKSVPAT